MIQNLPLHYRKIKMAEPIVIETVKMDDERLVEFAGKKKMIKTEVTAADGTPAIRIDFRNGETRIFKLVEALYEKFAMHGASQKIGDETAGLTDIEDMVMAVDALTDRLNKGEWSTKRDNSGLTGISVLARALSELSGKSLEDVKQFLASKSAAEKKALELSSKVSPIFQRMQAEKVARSKKPVKAVDDLLDELA